MTVLHSGTTKRYSSNWEQAFGKGKRTDASKSTSKKAAGKKPGKARKS